MMRFSSVLFLSTIWNTLFCSPLENKTVLVFGDSWGTTLYRATQTMFNRHGGGWTVKSSAVGGTTACQWAKSKTSLADEGTKLFGPQGPDFVWYTLGGNDVGSSTYQECLLAAKTPDGIVKCMEEENSIVTACTHSLLDNFFAKFPKSKVMQCYYDIPCEEGSCIPASRAKYCGTNVTCMNEGQIWWQENHVDPTAKKYPGFTSINILGTLQVAKGMSGASIGHPIVDKGSPCEWESGCVHPKGTVAQAAVTDQFWNLFFSKYA